MAYRLTETQQKICDMIRAQLAQKATPQLRFFWRHLRSAALPSAPNRGRNESVISYALSQVRHQRTAALCADSHVAASQLLKMEIELERESEASAMVDRRLTPEQLAAELTARLPMLPPAVQELLLMQLATLLHVRVVVE